MIVDFQAPSIGTMVEERGRAPVSNKERVMVYGLYAVSYTIILRGHGKATPPPYTEVTEPSSSLV